MNKKAQVQFMEMIFVLLILVVIIFMGFIFYYSFLYKGLEEKGERYFRGFFQTKAGHDACRFAQRR